MTDLSKFRLHDHLAQVLRWVDGDTVEVMLDLDFHTYQKESIRLLGIDTPERGQPGYNEARDRAAELAPPGSLVVVVSEKAPSRSFTRYLGHVIPIDGDGRSVSTILMLEGHYKK